MNNREWNMQLKAIFLIFCLFTSPFAFSTILWAGGEDIDFPVGAAVNPYSNAGLFRSGFAREAIVVTNGIAKSNAFQGGVVTSAWLSFREYSVANSSNIKMIGLGKSGTNNSLWISGGATWPYVALYKYDGTTWTLLATSPSGTLGLGVLNPGAIVMHVTNYGAAATVDVYNSTNLSSGPIFSYTGDVTAGGNASLDSVFLGGGNGSSDYNIISEIIVSDVDPRRYSLATLAPNAVGDLNQWTNTYTNVNPLIINDSTYISDNTSGDKFECKMNSLPAGTFQILSVKVAARGAYMSGGMTSLSVGIKTNATVYAPAATVQSTSFGATETYYSTNPFTSSQWSSTDVNALQINLQSAP